MYLINSFFHTIRWVISFLNGTDCGELNGYSVPLAQSPVTSALVIRPGAHNRPYAFTHQFAFQRSTIDHIKSWIFRNRITSDINAEYNRTLWINARAWWQDLYGDTIDDLDDHQDKPSLESVYHWYVNEITPLCYSDHPYQLHQVVHFIMLWWGKITQDPSDCIVKAHHVALRSALICAHPDKGGSHQAIQLLLQWKCYTPIIIDGHRHKQRLPIIGQVLNFSNKAKPWHVLRLFVDHMTQIEIQKNKNFYEENKTFMQAIQQNKEIIDTQSEKIKDLRCMIGIIRAEVESCHRLKID